MNRTDKVLCSIDRSMRILELGPLTTPIAPKSDGWLATVVDHVSQEQLVEKYSDDSTVDTLLIGDVDIVWSKGPLEAALPRELHGTFDAFIASHVLEHIPDPIGLLRSLEQVLRPGGVVSLAIPDKRFCFDFFRPLSTVGGLLDAHVRKAVRHTRTVLFDEVAYGIRADGASAFSQRPVHDIEFVHPLEQAKAHFDLNGGEEDGPYADVHGWVFTPSSFALAMLELSALNVIDFTVAEAFPTDGCEFFVTLRRGRVDQSDTNILQARRIELQRRMLEELREQAQMLLETPESDAARSETAERNSLVPAPSEIPFAPTAVSAAPKPTDDDSFVARVIAAYQFSFAGYEGSESFWDTSFADLKADVHDALISGDLDRVRHILGDPGGTDLFYGFDNLARSLIPNGRYVPIPGDQNGALIYRELLMLCQAIGVLPLRNPENPAENPATIQDVEAILVELDGALGFDITFPNPFPGEVGIATSRGIASYRAVQALYQARRVAALLGKRADARVLEIGAGMGRTAFYVCQLGISDYTIIDLPMTNVAQAAFLGRAMGEDRISLAGEARRAKARLLPPPAFFEASRQIRPDSERRLDDRTVSRECTQLLQCHQRASSYVLVNQPRNVSADGREARGVGRDASGNANPLLDAAWLRGGTFPAGGLD